jgi:membrane protein YqaA with SNARE-associated domain
MTAYVLIFGLDKLKDWFIALGPFGALLLAVADSFIPIPGGPDAAVVVLSYSSPALAPVTVLCATLGSVAGATALYLGARRAEQAALARMKPERRERVEHLLGKNDVLVIAGAAFAPPPFPFKIFNLAAGVFEVKVARFVLAVTLGRFLRYAGEAVLAVVYGEAALGLIGRYGIRVLAVAAIAGLGFWAYRAVVGRRAAAVGE